MNFRLIINIILLLGLNLLIKPFWILGIDVEVQNKLGNNVYGSYQALLSLSLIFAILLDLGIQTYNSRTVASSPKTFQSLFPNMIIAKLFFAILYVILISAIAYFLNYRGEHLYLLLLLGVLQIAVSFLIFIRSNIAALQRFNLDSIFTVLDKVVAIILCAYFLYIAPNAIDFKIHHFALFQVIGYATSLIIGWIITLRLYKFKWKGFQLNKVLIVIRKGIPYALLVFFMGIYGRVDILLIDVLQETGSEESGIYAASFRLLDLSNNMVGVLMASILMPLFVRKLAMKESLKEVLQLVSYIMLAVSLLIAIWVQFYGDFIIHFLYDHANDYTVRVLKILIWVFPITSLSYIYSTLLTADGKLKFLIGTAFVSGFLSLVLNSYFIPKYGAFASSIISIITHGVFVFWVINKVKKVYAFKMPWRFLAFMLFWFLVVSFAFYFIEKYLSLNWIVTSIICAVIGMILLFLTNAFSFNKMKILIRNNK